MLEYQIGAKSKARVRLFHCIPSAYFLHTFLRIYIYIDTKTRESARRRATPRVEKSAFVLIVLFSSLSGSITICNNKK